MDDEDIITFSEASMALNEPDRRWITDQIELADHRRSAARGGLIWANVITLFVAFTAGIVAFTRFETRTEDRLSAIEDSVHRMQATVQPAAAVSFLNGLNPNDLASNLGTVREVVKNDPSTVKSSPNASITLANKLLKIKTDTADYWPTALRTVNFVSAQVSGSLVPAPGVPQVKLSNTSGVGPFHDVRVLFDSGGIENATFTDCRIMFSKSPVRLRNVTFIRCVFEMPEESSPSEYLKQAGLEILASDFSKVFLRTLG